MLFWCCFRTKEQQRSDESSDWISKTPEKSMVSPWKSLRCTVSSGLIQCRASGRSHIPETLTDTGVKSTREQSKSTPCCNSWTEVSLAGWRRILLA